jgi:regulator of protease activity HflC (stomatin/prohibitin superfamily)
MSDRNKQKKGLDDDEKARIAGAVIILLIAGGIVGSILIIGGFETLDYNEYGIKQNVFTKQLVGQPVRGGGLQFVGIEYDFIRYPATWQTVDFTLSESADDIPINTQTKDGLAITFDASFQYRLNMSMLIALYTNFGMNYNTQIVQVSRASLRNVAARYSATQFLQNRTQVSDAMRAEVIDDLESLNIEIDYFQLRAITLPTAFTNATEQVEVAKLQQQVAQYLLAAAQIAAKQTVLEAEAAANVTIIAAFAAANVTITQAQAQASALNITTSMQGMTIADFMSITGFNASMVIAYFYVQALQNLPPGTTLAIGDFISLLLGT